MIYVPNIWIPRVGVLEGETKFSAGSVEGEYTITRRKADTLEIIEETGPFKNLITNAGLNRVGTQAPFPWCMVGTGTAPPAVTNTQLGSFTASTNAFSVGWNSSIVRGGPPEYWVQGSGTWRFAAGVATGNLTEVGVGWYEGSTAVPANHRLFSRALIVDSVGNPITITVLADEVLDVTYSIRYFPYIGPDIVQSVNISGVSYTFTTRPISIETQSWTVNNTSMSWTGNQTVITGTAAGTPPALAEVTATNMLNSGATSGIPSTMQPYIDGSLTMSAVFNANLTQGNLAYGIRGLYTQAHGSSSSSTFLSSRWQSTITPAIPKDATKVLSFGASISWSRKT